MILTPSEVASVAVWSKFWELCEYASEGVVFLGCVGEFIAEYTTWRAEDWRHTLGRRSLIFLILGIGGGLASLIKTNTLSGQVIGSLGQQVERAGNKAQSATGKADTAILRSEQAAVASGYAESKANAAENAASSALTLAQGARKEADSFERDIVSAKKQAEDAELRVVSAATEAAKANAELSRLKTPRSLDASQQSRIIEKLKPFSGQKFSPLIFPDGESIDLLRIIEGVLSHDGSGWIQSNIPFGDVSVGGAAGVIYTTGVKVRISAADNSSMVSRAAVALADALTSEGIPADAHFDPQDNNTAHVITLIIGKKP